MLHFKTMFLYYFNVHIYFSSSKSTSSIFYFLLEANCYSDFSTVYFPCNWSIVPCSHSKDVDVFYFSWRCLLCPKTFNAPVVKIIAWLYTYRKHWPRYWLVDAQNIHMYSLLVLIQRALLGIWKLYAGHCCTVGWVTRCSREELAPLSLLLALARDLHIFLLEALKEYKKD